MPNPEQVKEFFKNDLFATRLSGISIGEVDYHYAVCQMPLTERHKKARGTPMGGTVYSCRFCGGSCGKQRAWR